MSTRHFTFFLHFFFSELYNLPRVIFLSSYSHPLCCTPSAMKHTIRKKKKRTKANKKNAQKKKPVNSLKASQSAHKYKIHLPDEALSRNVFKTYLYIHLLYSCNASGHKHMYSCIYIYLYPASTWPEGGIKVKEDLWVWRAFGWMKGKSRSCVRDVYIQTYTCIHIYIYVHVHTKYKVQRARHVRYYIQNTNARSVRIDRGRLR